MRKIKVGIIGAGNISGIYLENGKKFDSMEVISIADMDLAKAQEKAAEHSIKGYSVEEMLTDPEVEMIINLTIPQAHAELCMKALNAGKHVYVEKPFTVTVEEGKAVVELAREKGLYVGSAPDTFLGGGIQTAAKIIEDGWIGTPISVTGFMLSGGHESWHPSPEFYYQKGGGPMLDMGPYYITAMVNMLGPINQVTGMSKITYPERTITSQPKYGQKVTVEVATHTVGVMKFDNGVIGSLITSFDTPGYSTLPRIEIHGSGGTLVVHDPNHFGGEIKIHRAGSREWHDMPLLYGHVHNNRGLGAADMAAAIIEGRQHRASGELGYHVLEVMDGIEQAATTGKFYELQSTCQKPELLPLGKREYQML